MIRRTRWSFGLSVTSNPPFVQTPWPRARTQFLHVFKAHAERYRRRRRLSLFLLIGFMLGAMLLTFVRAFDRLGVWAFGALMAAWLSAVVVVVVNRLRCPACGKRLEPARGPYCPQCGSDEYDRGKHKSGPLFGRVSNCPSCGGQMQEESGEDSRTYRIRGCTHCGVLLDQAGV